MWYEYTGDARAKKEVIRRITSEEVYGNFIICMNYEALRSFSQEVATYGIKLDSFTADEAHICRNEQTQLF